ncbi:hypothetical protein H6792_02680 [Candidatus Nomurabacteria bacterium]|nr:hypothetical protein [Candidatus Nomurabacteria bacterium]
MKYVITAGGQGTKLWPLSREAKPKQFQNIIGDQTLFKINLDTLLTEIDPEDIIIQTKERYLDLVRTDNQAVPEKNIILEPDFKKNRGPADGLTMVWLDHHYPGEPFILIQSDCLRLPNDRYLSTLKSIEELLIKDQVFITAGLKATRPDLGVDYFSLGEKLSEVNNISIYKIDKFIPRSSDYAETKKLIQDYHVSTHANHNAYYPKKMLEAYKKYRPDWYQALEKISKVLDQPDQVAAIYQTMESGATEDVTQHLFDSGALVLLPFEWIDVGTWDSIYQTLRHEQEEIYKDGQVIDIDSQRSLVKANPNKLVALLGVEDLVVVDSDDVLLVADRHRSGDISKVLKGLEDQSLDKYL